jgi:hypothetical protein
MNEDETNDYSIRIADSGTTLAFDRFYCFFVLVLHDAYQERYLAHLSELPSFRLVLVVAVGSGQPLSSSTSHGSSHTWLALAHLRQQG